MLVSKPSAVPAAATTRSDPTTGTVQLKLVMAKVMPNKNDPRYSSEIYCATKAGIINLTKYFAKNFSRKNIIVNSISPGGILNKKLQNKKFIQNYIKNVPLGRLANVKDIVGPIIFLCSDASNYINGHNLIVDGGLSC